MSELDNPVWASLVGAHEALAEGGQRARRYRSDVNMLAATADQGEGALRALAALPLPGESFYVARAEPVICPDGLEQMKSELGVQMVWDGPSRIDADMQGIVRLGAADAPDMLALATLTEPGPFLLRTHNMGAYFGIRAGGRLVAMAGERMRFTGYTEVSAVCTHPDYRGRGLARRLALQVAATILERGERPFLHSWKSNEAAIRLYERQGYRPRCDMHIGLFARPGAPET